MRISRGHRALGIPSGSRSWGLGGDRAAASTGHGQHRLDSHSRAFHLEFLARPDKKILDFLTLQVGHASHATIRHSSAACLERLPAPQATSRARDIVAELKVFQGSLAERFVGQELPATSGGEPYYWARAERGSTAAADYLIDVGGRLTPIEVETGPAGRLRSLRMLLEKRPHAAPGVVVSSAARATLPESPERQRCLHGGPALVHLQQITGGEEHRAAG